MKKIKQQITITLPLSPFSITLLYLVIGSIWMLISDQVIDTFLNWSGGNRMFLQVIKDWVYVVTTAAILFTLIQRLQQHLQSSEEKYRLLVDHLPDGVAILQESRVVFVNQALLRLIGATRSTEITDHQWSEYCQDSVHDNNQSYETRLRRLNGETVAVEAIEIPFMSQRQAFHQFVVRDISAQKQLEAERLASHADLEARVQRRTFEIQQQQRIAVGLRDILSVLNSNQSLKQILNFIAQQATALLGNDADAIFRLDASEDQLSIRTARGLPAAYVAQAVIQIGTGILGQAVQQQTPRYVEDLQTYLAELPEQTPLHDLVQLLVTEFRAMLAVPLIIRDEIYGGLMLYYREPQTFSEEQIRLAVAFSNQAALAIENARLQTELEETAIIAERNRIARDLHDAVTQTLFSVSLIAEVIPAIWEINRQEGENRLNELRELTRGALAEMRALLLELRPTALTKLSLRELVQQLADAIMGRARIPVLVSIEESGELPEVVKIALYRILQEALNNILKHSRASEVRIFLDVKDDVCKLHVIDDGCGFDEADITGDHLGLGIMRERAQAIGATFRINSMPEQGTHLTVIWQNEG